MIKVLLKTFAVLSLFLCGVNLYASDLEEAVAPWEREADSKIWSQRIISDTLSAGGDRMPLNALCDKTAFETIESLKENAVSTLQRAADEGPGASSGSLAAKILKNISEISITPLQEDERELLVTFSSLPLSISLKDFLSSGKGERDELAFTPPSAALTNSSQFNYKVKKIHSAIAKRAGIKDLCANVNLNDYSFKAAKIDLYDLFLYIWEDNPFAGGSIHILLLPVFPASSFTHTFQCKPDHIPFHNTIYINPHKILKGAASC
jgi:hypothetical protein